jgi:hypothetical protein
LKPGNLAWVIRYKVEKLGDLRSFHHNYQQNARVSLDSSVHHKSREPEILDLTIGLDKLIVNKQTTALLLMTPIFYPAKEVLSLFPNFLIICTIAVFS